MAGMRDLTSWNMMVRIGEVHEKCVSVVRGDATVSLDIHHLVKNGLTATRDANTHL